ncbi:hypothetical protein KBC03_03635 [Patescibacteria group bacterium]|nr:hypothetical protein [Patescibacteria group bacterium]
MPYKNKYIMNNDIIQSKLTWADYKDHVPVPHYLSEEFPILYEVHASGKETITGKCIFPKEDEKIKQRGHVNYLSLIECLQSLFFMLGAAWNMGRIRRAINDIPKQLAYHIDSRIHVPLKTEHLYEFYGECIFLEGNKEKWVITLKDRGHLVAELLVEGITTS